LVRQFLWKGIKSFHRCNCNFTTIRIQKSQIVMFIGWNMKSSDCHVYRLKHEKQRQQWRLNGPLEKWLNYLSISHHDAWECELTLLGWSKTKLSKPSSNMTFPGFSDGTSWSNSQFPGDLQRLLKLTDLQQVSLKQWSTHSGPDNACTFFRTAVFKRRPAHTK
jgi:hypothetical protein